jgi:ABC-type phosphate/phosphonate transport system ATPase subunit
MRKSRFTDEQMVAILAEAGAGTRAMLLRACSFTVNTERGLVPHIDYDALLGADRSTS